MEGHDTTVKRCAARDDGADAALTATTRMVLSKLDGLLYSICDDRTIRVWDTNVRLHLHLRLCLHLRLRLRVCVCICASAFASC